MKSQNLWAHIVNACDKFGTNEFEFVIEDWGFMWYPWFIYVNSKSIFIPDRNLVEQADMNYLISINKIELIKEYTTEELFDLDLSRVRYRLIRDVEN